MHTVEYQVPGDECARRWNPDDAGPGQDLSSAFARWGIETLDLVVASHPHADHIGGMWQVLESVPTRFLHGQRP